MGAVVIDPGAAAMQPSYPLPPAEKRELRRRAVRKITECWRRASVVVVTHYHYDHHILPDDPDLSSPRCLFENKLLILKSPNTYINESQWNRSRLFIKKVLELFGADVSSYLEEPRRSDFPDPLDELVHATQRDFGDYTARRLELLEKGRRWFKNLVRKLWGSEPWVKEIDLGNIKIVWGEGRILELGDTRLRVLGPWFHGIEYDRTGWVTPLLVEKKGGVIFFTSDLMGPQIEDYAYTIADLKPRVLVADGPPTYLFPYMLNRVNLRRAVENMIYILENAAPQLVVYDHHLLRERRWRSRVEEVFRTAEKIGTAIMTAAEVLGKRPLIDQL